MLRFCKIEHSNIYVLDKLLCICMYMYICCNFAFHNCWASLKSLNSDVKLVCWGLHMQTRKGTDEVRSRWVGGGGVINF